MYIFIYLKRSFCLFQKYILVRLFLWLLEKIRKEYFYTMLTYLWRASWIAMNNKNKNILITIGSFSKSHTGILRCKIRTFGRQTKRTMFITKFRLNFKNIGSIIRFLIISHHTLNALCPLCFYRLNRGLDALRIYTGPMFIVELNVAHL